MTRSATGGRSAAVETGWKRARRTIIAADAVNFLAALVLYVLASSNVRGFAFTLGLTTLIDMLVVFLFTHPMVPLLASTKFFGDGTSGPGSTPQHLGATGRVRATAAAARSRPPRPSGAVHAARPARCDGEGLMSASRVRQRPLHRRRSIDFVGRQKTWYAISAVLIALALVGLFARGLNFGMEFRGGSEFRVQGVTNTQGSSTRRRAPSPTPAPRARSCTTSSGRNRPRPDRGRCRPDRPGARPRWPRPSA